MKPIDMKKLLGVVVQTEGLSSDTTLLKLFQHLTFENFRDEIDLLEAVNASHFLKGKLERNVFDVSRELIYKHELDGIKLLPIGEENYPICLEITSRPPAILYVKGELDCLRSVPGVAVVGSREISSAGTEITRRITTQLCEHSFVIVSGLAIGVDATAHRAALQARGKTIAVLAHGLEEAKPKQNTRLGLEILERGGIWVSEYPMGRRAMKQSFVQRNRIQVGLSSGSVLIEASLDSGTMTQAEFCIKEKRPLFAVVPHRVDNPLHLNCEGTQSLVDKGDATPLRTKDDYDGLVKTLLISKENLNQRDSFFSLSTPSLL
ncbi:MULTISPECIES: DNA-processing protein DprA [Aeromonas]|uniref:DNA-processing protein DprA n=1 Tax=Aeromonas TaxID=642 RepID=UPI001D09BAFB|nr:DNA-processing protein DprA [Aeromonas caviae]MCR3986058.1 DNA-protecting protein DprA [Aeromonas caviae]MDH0241335.1 DNA-protecting protein DprA [Aeromonas caviae]MDT8952974.1 DNA-processing protein DprA [Aeromonas caviae]UDN28825.1 DNA-protecting protein DprA [Aeromonas caviae]